MESGRFSKVPHDQRPGQGADQWIAIHVQRVGAQGWTAEVLGELVLGIDHHGLDSATIQSALANDLHVFPALADIEGHGHHLSTCLLGQPADAHTGVEAAGVRQDNPIAHLSSSFSLLLGWRA